MTRRQTETSAATSPEGQVPNAAKLPGELETALSDIGSALDRVIRLALPNAEYGEDGTPLSSDAEVEDACRTAQKALATLEKTLAEGREAVVRSVFVECEDRLYQQAVTNFEDPDVEEEEAYHHKTGRFEGAFLVATKLVPDLDRADLFRKAESSLIQELRESIPRLRDAAGEPERCASTGDEGVTRFREEVDLLGARYDLLEHERALDNLLYHARHGYGPPRRSAPFALRGGLGRLRRATRVHVPRRGRRARRLHPHPGGSKPTSPNDQTARLPSRRPRGYTGEVGPGKAGNRTVEREVEIMDDERNQTTGYEVDVRREISTDFLEEAHGALYQARVQGLARDLSEEGYDLKISYRFGPGTVSLIVGAARPEPLHELASAVSALGYELPEPYERPDRSPEDLDGIRSGQAGGCRDLEVQVPHGR